MQTAVPPSSNTQSTVLRRVHWSSRPGRRMPVQGCIAPVFPAGGGVYMADDSRFRVNVIDAPVRVVHRYLPDGKLGSSAIHIAHVAIVGLEMFEPGDTYAGDML